MAIVEKKPEPTQAKKTYWGFSSEGKFFRSDTPIDNACTNITLELLDGIKRNLWSPAEVILELTRKPDWYVRLFPYWLTGTWGGADRYHLWPLVPESNSVNTFLKRQGTGQGPWIEHEAKWSADCDRYEKMHSLTPRAVDPSMISELLARIGG